MRLQRANVVLEPDSDMSFDSEDDMKNFENTYSMFKEEFNDLIDNDSYDTSDP